MTDFNVAGIVPISTVDWKGKSCMTIFFRNCNFNCIYCHNKDYLKGQSFLSFEEIKNEINTSSMFIGSVIFSGGEATIQKDLQLLIDYVKSKKLKVGIHTNGYDYDKIKMLNNVDKYFIDIKAPLANAELYSKITSINVDINKIVETIKMIYNKGIDIELRTTVFENLISTSDIREISKWISENVPNVEYVIQRGHNHIDKGVLIECTPAMCIILQQIALEYIDNVSVRFG
ncbi:MAG: anaerobic ribonucleoside-triphosphate reductase activating protein [Methanogenium sp.]|jgi:pyruvate formate lyase activating enzyme